MSVFKLPWVHTWKYQVYMLLTAAGHE